ncbi:MAG: hypothetical protein FJ298_04850 [Planctomycetes bacterium]|nr:hypothetical protein [Planctomycetota bacterium]
MRLEFPQIALGIAGAALVLWTTSASGFAMVQLGMHNAVAAECLLRGEEWQTVRGEAFAHWPPLFVVLLAAGRALGASYETTARLLNAVSLLATVMLAMHWSRRFAAARWVGWVVGAGLVFQPSLLAIHGTLASEPLFLPLVLGSLVAGQAHAERPRPALLVLATLLAALACLQRYVGVVDVFVLAALGFWSWPERTRWRDTTLFLVGSLAPLGGWLARNFVLTGSLTGTRPPSDIEFDQNLLDGWSAIRTSWTGATDDGWLGTALALATILLALVGGLSMLLTPQRRRIALWALAFPAAYASFLLGLASWIWLDPLDARLLSPLIVWTCLLAPVGLHAWLERAATLRPWLRPVSIAVAAAGALALLSKGSVAIHDRMEAVRVVASEGVARSSEFLRWLAEHPLEGTVHSNAPEAYALATWRPAQLVPTRHVVEALLALPESAFPMQLVWFDPKGTTTLLGKPVRKRLSIEVEREFPDGAILEVRRRQP